MVVFDGGVKTSISGEPGTVWTQNFTREVLALMSSISNLWVMFFCKQLLVAHLCQQAKPLFYSWMVPKVSILASNQIWAKTHSVYSHDISSVAAGPFHVLHMWPMSDVLWQNKVLVAHLCQAKSLFWLDAAKTFQASNQIWDKSHAVL
jgi:hypothetical protein